MENFLKKRPSFYFLVPVLILILIISVWKSIVHPLISQWVQDQVPQINSSQEFINVNFESLDFSLLKMQGYLKNVEISFKGKYADLKTIKAEQVKAQLNPFDLLVGRLKLSSISIEKLNWGLTDKFFDSTSEPISDLPLDMIFKQLPNIPLDKIKLNQSEFHFFILKKKMSVDLNIDLLTIENLKNKINLEAGRISQTIQFEKNSTVKADAQIKMTLTKDLLRIIQFNLKSLGSELNLTGQLTSLKKTTSKPEGELVIRSTLLCDDLRSIYLNLFPQKNRYPSVAGQILANGKITFLGINDVNAQFDLKTVNLTVDQFKLGSAQIKSQIKKNQLFIDQINLEHPAGLAEFNQIEIEQKKPFNFKTKLNVKSVNLQKVFVSLGLTHIPADLNISGQADCAGKFLPPFDIECKTLATLSDLEIQQKPIKGPALVKLEKILLDGSVVFNDEDIQFDSQIKVGESAGSAKGIIDYSKGFKIDFVTDKLMMSDVKSLAGLDLKAELKLQGSTWGDSSQARVETEFSANKTVIEKFLVGNFSSQLVFEKSHLYFRKLLGKLGSTDYAGSLDFDFNKFFVEGKITSAKLSGEDISATLNNKFDLPFEFSGQGQAEINFLGPLDFWKLTYSLKSQLRQGQIAEEGFERLDLNLGSDGHRIVFSDVQLKKIKSSLILDGFINTEKTPEFNLKVKTKSAYLEEIDSVLKFLPTLTGQIAVNGDIFGTLKNPEIKLDFNTKAVTLDGFSYLPSQGQVGFNKKYLQLNGQLFGRQIQTDLKWPWNNSNDYSLKLQVRDLNLLLLLPLISLPQPTSDFYSHINFDLDLSGPAKNLKSTSGQIKLADLLLQRGTDILKLKAPVQVTFNNGLRFLDPFDLVSEDGSHIRIKLISSTADEAKLDLSVALKLRILQFLVPFIESLNGQLQAKAQLSLKSGPVQIFGEGSLTEGSLQFKGFPTALDKISTPIEFSQSKIFLNTIQAKLGQSEITGSGTVEIKGSKNVVVQLQANADNLELTFPEKVTTSGRADMNFFGSWLPYTFKVNYKINKGLVEKDFGEEKRSEAMTIKASRFLPSKQFEQQAPSLLLDINTDLSAGVFVKNKLLEGVAFGNLKIKGSPESPVVLGKIEIKQGSKITFKDKPFEVQTANLQFNDGNDNVPDVYLSALARISDYDINLLVQGIPNKNLAIKPTSQPPLSEPDIFSLLALGMTSKKLDQNLSSEAQQQQTSIELLASITNQSTINKKIQEKLGLTVQLAPSLDSTRNIAVPKVVVSRNLLKKLNASYARPLNGDNQNHEVKLQYLFNPNWSGILNYQNKETETTTDSVQKKNQSEGVLGGDVEYKKEFKW